MKRAARALGGDVHAVIVGSLDDQFDIVGERLSVLWGTDDFAAAGSLMGLSPQWLREREQRQLEKADVVTAVSEPLAQRWRAMGKDVTVIANGVDTAQYVRCDQAPLPADVGLRPPIVSFIGHLSDRIDIAILEAIAHRGHSLLLVGPRQLTFELERLQALLALPNVQWVGPKPFEQLPSYLRITAVGITPYADTPFNRASFPLKTLEYLAAGRPTVSTDLPSARALSTDLVTIADSPESFAAATSRLLAQGSSERFIADARTFAAAHDWDARAADMAKLLGLT
jgi:teichuronic acid biosynthesis glycosyltransferase TuaH